MEVDWKKDIQIIQNGESSNLEICSLKVPAFQPVFDTFHFAQ